MVPMVMLGAEGGADAASLVTTVTDMAGTMLTTMAANPILGTLSVFPLLVQLSALSVS